MHDVAGFPELMVLLAAFLTMVCWRVVQMIITVLAVALVLVVLAGFAVYGLFSALVS